MKKERADDGVFHIGAERKELLQQLAAEEGTPIFVIDHEKIRQNYREFRSYMPMIQVYYAVKANSHPAIVLCFNRAGRMPSPSMMILPELSTRMWCAIISRSGLISAFPTRNQS